MLKTVIRRESFPPAVLPGVEAANRLLEEILRTLEGYDITATWRCLHIDEKPTVVFLDLVSVHRGREYAVKDFSYPFEMFTDPNLTDLPGIWDQVWWFTDELSRLDLDDLKDQRARAAEYDLAGAL